ncbi:MAG: hypothetical protein R3B91_15310 [Planctomycetaceae bacterium]
MSMVVAVTGEMHSPCRGEQQHPGVKMRGLRTPIALMLLTATFFHHQFVSSAAAGPYPPIGQSVSSGYSLMSPYPSIGHSVQPQNGPYPMLGHTVDQVSYEQTSYSPESLCDSCCDEVFCDPARSCLPV